MLWMCPYALNLYQHHNLHGEVVRWRHAILLQRILFTPVTRLVVPVRFVIVRCMTGSEDVDDEVCNVGSTCWSKDLYIMKYCLSGNPECSLALLEARRG